MKIDDATIYTILNLEQKLIEETFPYYTLYLGFSMFATHYLVVVLFLGSSDPSLQFDRIVWIGTYITPYIFHFWVSASFLILIFLFFRDYRMGFRQIKLEANQITLYPKQKSKELQVFSWEYSIQSVLLSKQNNSFTIDLKNRILELPSNSSPSTLSKIKQFYKISPTEALSDKAEFQDED
jgi:hypothetical protein